MVGLGTGLAALAFGLVVVALVGRRYRPIAAILLVAFLLRAAVAVYGMTLGTLPDSTRDAVRFERLAAEWSSEGFAGLFDHFTIGAYLYSWLLGAAYAAFGRSPLLAVSLNVLFGTLIVLNVYLMGTALWNARAGRRAAWLAALFPSLILYSAVLMREVAVVYPATLAAYFLVRWINEDRPGFALAAVLLLSLATAFHKGMMVALLAVGFLMVVRLAVSLTGRTRLSARRALVAFGFFLLLVGGVVVAASAAGRDFLGTTAISEDQLERRQAVGATARSAYLEWLPQESFADVAWQAPLRAAYFVASPMPWMVGLPKDVVGLLDGLAYVALAVALVRGRRELMKNPTTLALLLLVLGLLLVFSVNTFNAGTALRHRAKLAPILFALLPTIEWLPMRRGRSAPRVLHVVNAPESFLQNRLPVAVAAREAGYDVQVAGPAGDNAAQIRRLGFPYHVVRLDRRGTNPFAELATLFALVRLYRRLRPDLVHHFTIKPVAYGGIAARVARVPACVHTITGLGYVFTSRDLRARALRPVVSLAYSVSFDHPNCRVVFQNVDDSSLLLAQGVALRERTGLIRGSGVDLDAFAPGPEPPGAPVVVLPSRMLRDKGVEEFVEAARRLKGTGARFVLVGDTDPGNPAAIPREALEAWAKEGAVEWWGWRSDMRSVYDAAHVVCLPSYREGVPKTLLEAGACGRALVATDVPGCRDVVLHGRTGLLVPPRDAGALAEALRTLIVEPRLRERLGLAARAHVESSFGAKRVASLTMTVYASLLRRRPTARPSSTA